MSSLHRLPVNQRSPDMDGMQSSSRRWMIRLAVAQLMARSSAALLVVLVLMASPQASVAQVDGYQSHDVTDEPPASPPPPPAATSPPLRPTTPPPPESQNLVSSPPPAPLLPPPPASQNPTASSPPPPATSPPAPASAPPATARPAVPWNASNYPASDFRNDSVKSSFVLWPEDLPYAKFVYFCQQTSVKTKRNLTDFTYKNSEGRLQIRPYFDLGLVDKYNTPYFRHWGIDWRVDIHRIVCPIACEYTDIQRLYEYRLHRNVLLTGFGCGVIALAILQLGVMVSIILLWVVNSDEVRRKAGAAEDQSLGQFLWDWCRNVVFWARDFVPDWVHLVLLVMVGFSMMEGAGHSNFFEWRSMLFYNFGVSYTWLTLVAMLSSILFQCAHFLSSRKSGPARKIIPQPSKAPSRKASTKTAGPLLEGDNLPTVNPVKEVWDSDDWKYQRVFGQMGVLVLMSMYLLPVDDYEGKSMDSLASVIVGAIVVACIWSFAAATVVAIRSLRRIFQDHLFRKSCTRNPSTKVSPV